MIAALNSKCATLQTRPALAKLLEESLRAWLSHTGKEKEFHVSPAQFPREFGSLIRQQNMIGWRQFFNGRFSAEWGRLQDDYYSRDDISKGNKVQSGQRWQVTIIGFIWEQWFLVWSSRNQGLHGADVASRAAAAQQAVDRSLAEIYQARDLVEPRVRDLLYEDAEYHRRFP